MPYRTKAAPTVGLPPDALREHLTATARPAWVIRLAARPRVAWCELGERAAIVAALDRMLGPGAYTIEPPTVGGLKKRTRL